MPPAAPIVAAAAPYVAVGMGALTAYGGYKQHQAGKKLKKYGRRYEEEQIRLADEFAETQRIQGLRAQEAAMAAAHAMGRQAHMMRAAAAETKAIAAKNAKLVIKQGEEQLRRVGKENKQVRGTAKARLWSSGLLANRGSLGVFQKSLKKEHGRQESAIEYAFKRQAEVVKEGGDIEAALLAAQAVGVSAGAAAAAAEGLAAYENAILAGNQARSQAQLSGDEYIRRGKSMMSGGLGKFALGLGGMAMPFMPGGAFGGSMSAGTTSSGGGGAGSFTSPSGGLAV